MSIISNIDIYQAIAEEAHSAMKASLAQSKSPKLGGEPGYVKRWDPDQRSFKNALIAITFAGIYVDALLYIRLLNRLGRAEALRVDRRSYKDRLERLTVSDSSLLDRLQAFKGMRNDLVHEKALDLNDFGTQRLHKAEDAADCGLALMKELREQ